MSDPLDKDNLSTGPLSKDDVSAKSTSSELDLNEEASKSDSSPDPTESSDSSTVSRSPGAELRAARELQGWTVDQVASYLKLAPRQVLALERDDYASLPGMPIVRGFVRSYAKLLKISAAPLLVKLGGETVLSNESLAPKAGLSTPFSEARLPSMGDRPGISSKWVVAVLVVALAGAVGWAFQQDGALLDFSQTRLAPTVQSLPKPESEPEPVAEAATDEVSAEPAAGVVPSLPLPEQAAVSSPETASVPVAATADQAQSPAPKPAEMNTLSVNAREDSWVEIRPVGGGNALISRLMKAGETASVEVNEPTVLVLGNAAGVDVTLRGSPVALKANTVTNVARVTLK